MVSGQWSVVSYQLSRATGKTDEQQSREGGFYFGEDRWDIGDIGDLWDTDEA